MLIIIIFLFVQTLCECSPLYNQNYAFVFNDKANASDIDSLVLYIRNLLNVTNSPKSTFSTPIHNTRNDPKGAFLYMVVIMLIFAAIVLLILVAKVKPRKLNVTDTADREKAEYLLRNMQEHVVTEKILEQLRNREYRSKAWDIYRSHHKGRRNSKLERTLEIKELDTIKNIDQKLENIQRSKKELEEKSYDELNLSFRNNSNLKNKLDKSKLDKSKIGVHKNVRKLSRDGTVSALKKKPSIVKAPKTRDTKERLNSDGSNKDSCYYTITGNSLEKIPIKQTLNLFNRDRKSVV